MHWFYDQPVKVSRMKITPISISRDLGRMKAKPIRICKTKQNLVNLCLFNSNGLVLDCEVE